MKNIFKKNQIVIGAIALMLITVGYLSYSMKTDQVAQTSDNMIDVEMAGIGDAKLVSSNLSNKIDENNVSNSNEVSANSKSDIQNGENANNGANLNSGTNANNKTNEQTDSSEMAKNINKLNNQINSNLTSQTSANSENSSNYFAESKLERDNMYSEMLESYQSILANNNVSAEQKDVAQKEISKINFQKNGIMITENLVKNKGFEDVVIFVNNDSVSVVVKSDKLEQADIAQIQSIVQRELNSNIENIHISNK